MQKQSDSNGGIDAIRKTDATIQAYLDRGRILWLRAAREIGLYPEEVLPTVYLAWLEKLLPTVKPASRRQYIAASKEFLGRRLESLQLSTGGQDNLEAAIKDISSMQSRDYPCEAKATRHRGRTSSQKAKKIDRADIRRLFSESRGMRGKWIDYALVWFYTNIWVGLRPSEWRHAYLEEQEGKVTLVVMNAKHSNGRSHGEKRHQVLTDLEFDDLNHIRAQLRFSRKYAGDDSSWNAYYSGVRKTLHLITRKILPNRRNYPSLYSSRHQFAADAKSAGMSKVELAALMGHAVDDTAGSHYGKKKHGSGACRVKADPQEMDQVRIKSQAQPDDEPGMKF